MSNVPDNWGMYYQKCWRCGGRYHASEGGCGCLDNLECMCGKGNWDHDETPTCQSCNTGSYVQGRTHRRKHVARKTYHYYNGGTQLILPGDVYERIVTFGYYPGGAFTLKVERRLISKGHNWIVYDVMDS